MNQTHYEPRYIGMDIHKRYAVIGGVNPEQKEAFSCAQFMRWQLMQLGIGHELTHIPLPNATEPSQRLRLATAEEARAIFA